MQQNWSTMLETMAQANEKAVVAATEFNRITARMQGLLARKQLAALEDYLDAGTKHLKVAAQAHDPQEAIKRHAEVAVELAEKLVATAQESLGIQVQVRDELVRWMEDGMKTAQAEAEAVIKPAAVPRRSSRSARKPA